MEYPGVVFVRSI